MANKKEIKNVSQVQNRISADELGEEELRDVVSDRNLINFQLNEAGGPLGEEFTETD